MNLELLNPFLRDFPSSIGATLDDSAVCARFNPSGLFAGHLLAAGRSDGIVTVWDLETKQQAWFGEGHVKQVETLCWSRNSRYLLSCSKDCNAIVWDLKTGDRRETIRFDAPIISAYFHPFNSKIMLITLSNNTAFFVDRRNKTKGKYELVDVEASSGGAMTVDDNHEAAASTSSQQLKKPSLLNAKFTPDGTKIFACTTDGSILIFSSLTRFVIGRIKVSNSPLKTLEFDKLGRHIVTNSLDRAIRVFSIDQETGEITPMHKFQDLINRTPWAGIGFSSDGEYVIGGAGRGNVVAHDIYIWDRTDGNLMKVLEGPKEPLEDVHWNPRRPLIASVSALGTLHIWVTPPSDTWSAFAPGFEELEENDVYVEMEDEFDLEDESELARRKRVAEDERVEVMSFAMVEEIDASLNASLPDVKRWWEDDPDEDTKTDFFIPLRLEEDVDWNILI